MLNIESRGSKIEINLQIQNIMNVSNKLNICLNICLIMSFKTITIKKSIYEKLLAIKKENESFSDLFERLSNNNVAALKKLRGCTTFENKEEILKDIYKKRKEKRYG